MSLAAVDVWEPPWCRDGISRMDKSILPARGTAQPCQSTAPAISAQWQQAPNIQLVGDAFIIFGKLNIQKYHMVYGSLFPEHIWGWL